MEHYFEEIRNHDPVKPDLEKSSDDDIRGDVLCNLTNLLKADMNTHYFPFISDYRHISCRFQRTSHLYITP